jgi:hypothetical protein
MAFTPHIRLELSADEQYVVWACLQANVMDIHQPVYNLSASQLAAGERLLERINELGEINGFEREIAYALGHGIAEVDALIADGELADQLAHHFTEIIDGRAA